MRGLWKLIVVEMKLYLREPAATFFTIAFAPMCLLIFGTIYGNKPEAFFGGRGMVDISVPSYIAMIIIGGLGSIPGSVFGATGSVFSSAAGGVERPRSTWLISVSISWWGRGITRQDST